MTPVAGFLTASPCAKRRQEMTLGEGISTSIWHNEHDEVHYNDPKGHTISFYVKGGEGTRRLDRGAIAGWTGAICVMPEGQSSDWEITDPFEFLHLYLDDAILRRTYSKIFDRDSRLMALEDITYFEDPLLTTALYAIYQATLDQDHMALEESLQNTVHALFTSHYVLRQKDITLSGGLSPKMMRIIDEYLDAHLDQAITLEDLGKLTGLSPFHLQRCFTASRGVSPQNWITAKRIARAKAMIRQGNALADVTFACGFTSQGHFSRRFKALIGITPGVYRKAL